MGKDTKAIQRGDTFQRINYLYQAAHKALMTNPGDLELVRTYVQSLKAIAEKGVLRLDASMKRTLCKRCYMLLVPGITSTIRMKSKRQKHLVVTCLECRTVKRFNLNPAYKLWSQQPEAWFTSVPKYVLDQKESEASHEPSTSQGINKQRDPNTEESPSTSTTLCQKSTLDDSQTLQSLEVKQASESIHENYPSVGVSEKIGDKQEQSTLIEPESVSTSLETSQHRSQTVSTGVPRLESECSHSGNVVPKPLSLQETMLSTEEGLPCSEIVTI